MLCVNNQREKSQISRHNFLCCKPEILLPTYTPLSMLCDPWMKGPGYCCIIFAPCSVSRPEFGPALCFLKHCQFHGVWCCWNNLEYLSLKPMPLHIHKKKKKQEKALVTEMTNTFGSSPNQISAFEFYDWRTLHKKKAPRRLMGDYCTGFFHSLMWV